MACNQSQVGFDCGCDQSPAAEPCPDTSCINKQVINIEVDIWDDPGCEGDNVVRIFNTDECVYHDGYYYWSLEDMNVDQPPSAKWSAPSTKCQMLKPSEPQLLETTEGVPILGVSPTGEQVLAGACLITCSDYNDTVIVSGEISGTDLLLTTSDGTVITIDASSLSGGNSDDVVISGVVTGTDIVLTTSSGSTVTVDASSLSGGGGGSDGVVTSGVVTGTDIVLTTSTGGTVTIDASSLSSGGASPACRNGCSWSLEATGNNPFAFQDGNTYWVAFSGTEQGGASLNIAQEISFPNCAESQQGLAPPSYNLVAGGTYSANDLVTQNVVDLPASNTGWTFSTISLLNC